MRTSRLEELYVQKDPTVQLALLVHCFAPKDPTQMKQDLPFARLVQVDIFAH